MRKGVVFEVGLEILGQLADHGHAEADGTRDSGADIHEKFRQRGFTRQLVVKADTEFLARRDFLQLVQRVAAIADIELFVVSLARRRQHFGIQIAIPGEFLWQ